MKSNNKQSKKVPQPVGENWDFYFDENKAASTAINQALKEVAPIKEKPNLARIEINMKHPRLDGLSSQEEYETLAEIEMTIANQGQASNSSIHVARHTEAGKRILFFYCDDRESFKEMVRDVMAGNAEYQYDLDFQKDQEWQIYFGLYPTKRQSQSMMNRRVIDQLVKRGDNLFKAREVDHTLYFKHKIDRKSFLSEVKKQGFTINRQYYEKSFKEHPYGLFISRVDTVDWSSVDKYVSGLIKMAEKHHGFYSGWATWNEKDETPPATGMDMTPCER